MTHPPSDIRAVLFDAGGTLVRAYPSVGHVYAAEAARFGVKVSPETLSGHFAAAWKRLRPQENHESPFRTSEAHERAWWQSLVEAVFDDAGLLDAFGDRFDAFFAALYDRFESADVWEVFDDVLPALASLERAGVRCAVVSNWDSRLPRLMDALDLSKRFEFILTSAEAGYSKPHAAIFQEAVQKLGVPPENVVNVGDSLNEDVVGALEAGLHAAHLDRTGRAGSLRTLTALMELVRV